MLFLRCLAVVVCCVTSVRGASCASTGAQQLSYDEVRIIIFTRPAKVFVDSPPGSFERDYSWAVHRRGDEDHRSAILRHVAYWAGWTRVESDESTQFANRKLHQVIYIDKRRRTFRVYTGPDADKLLARSAVAIHGYVAGMILRSGKGTETIQEQHIFTALGTRMFNGFTARGKRLVVRAKAISVKGSCASGLLSGVGYQSTTVRDEYRSTDYLAPDVPPFYLDESEDYIGDSCRRIVMQPPDSSAQREFGKHFLLYQREEFRVHSAGIADRGAIIDIMERGHFRRLSASEASFVRIPVGYRDQCVGRPVLADCRPFPQYPALRTSLKIRLAKGSNPWSLIQSTRGDIWFAENSRDRLGRLDAQGKLQEIALPKGSRPAMLSESPDGKIWFTEEGRGVIASASSDATVQERAHVAPRADVEGIAVLPDGTIGFTEFVSGKVGIIPPDGPVHEFAMPTASSTPSEIVAGPDGNFWLSEFSSGRIGRVSRDGSFSEWPTRTSDLFNLRWSNGRLWFTAGDVVGYRMPDGSIRTSVVPRTDSRPDDILPLPDGRAAFSETSGGRIGIVDPSGNLREWRVGGSPNSLLLDTNGNLWFTDGDSIKIIPAFLQATRHRDESKPP